MLNLMERGRGALKGSAQAIDLETSNIAEQAVMDPERVRSHVDKILGSADFAAAPQLAAFLRYIVEKRLAGEQDFIKAYTIATEALGRPTDFDAQNDPIVRVQARRLRQALLLYYADNSADHSLRIVLPVGGYVPEFAVPGSEPAEEAPKTATADEKPASKPLFETRWIAPVSLILSLLSMILSLWPGVIRYVLGP